MSFKEICQKIKLLISSILNKDQELEERKKEYDSKLNESVALLVNVLKQIAPIRLKYFKNNNNLGVYKNRAMVWHQEYGIALNDLGMKQLEVSGEDFKLDAFVKSIETQLQETLQKIDSDNNDTIKNTENLEELIDILKQWQEGSE